MSRTLVLYSLVIFLLVAHLPNASGQANERRQKQVSGFSEPAQALEYFIERRKSERIGMPSDELVERFGDQQIAALLEGMIEHSDKKVRLIVKSTLVDVTRKSADQALRRRVVHKLILLGLSDPNGTYDLSCLDGFKEADFNEDAKRLLLDELSRKRTFDSTDDGPDDGIVRCIGRAGVREAIPTLIECDEVQRKVAPNPVNPFHKRSAILALARLGEKPYIAEAIRLVDEMPDKEQRVVSLQHLVYVKQPEVVEYLKKYLFSDIAYETNSLDVVPVSEAEYASFALSDMLKDFPKGTIEEKRKWMQSTLEYNLN